MRSLRLRPGGSISRTMPTSVCGDGARRRSRLSSRQPTAVVTDVQVSPQGAIEVYCEAPDVELLLVEWLNSVIYEMAVRKMLFGRFEVRIDGGHLHGTLWGEPVDVERHAPACEPKGATYTALRVAKASDGRWSAACIIDV